MPTEYIKTEEHKRKISESMKGRTLTEEHKRKIGDAHIGMKRSLETKIKMSISAKGNQRWLGKKHTEKTKEKISLANNKDKNGNWKGDKVGYSGVHHWIKKQKPKPELCECCKINKPFDLANISGKYKRDSNDFEWICRKCHIRKDGRINNLNCKLAGIE